MSKELIIILEAKKILTKEEAKALLHRPKEENDHNEACLHAYRIETGVKPEDFDTLPFGEEAEWSHTKEAATAHLKGAGLTFEGFSGWTIAHNKKISITEDYDLAYRASLVRQYIREHSTL